MSAWRQLRAAAGALALAAPLALVAAAAPAAAEAPLKLRFVMPTTPADYLLPYFVAEDKGWLAKWGLSLDEMVVTGDATATRAVLAGSADIGYVGVGPALSAVAEGATIKLVGSGQPIVDYVYVVRKGLATDIPSLADKRWASYGPGGLSTALPVMLLKKYGLDYRKASFVSVGDQPSRLQAVVGGKVDATLIDSYTTTVAERAGQITPVVAAAKEFPGMGNCFLVVDRKLLADPEGRRAVGIMVRAGIEGARFIMQHPDEAAEIMMHRLPSGNLEALKETLHRVDGLGIWGVNGGLERSVIDDTVSTYFDMGQLSRKVTYEELVDPSLVDAALAELGRFP